MEDCHELISITTKIRTGNNGYMLQLPALILIEGKNIKFVKEWNSLVQ